MKRVSISSQFPDVIAHRSEISVAAIGSTTTAALGKAIRKLFRHPSLKKKQIHSAKMTVSITNVDMRAVEKMFEEPESEQAQAEEPKEQIVTTVVEAEEPKKTICKHCGEEVSSLARHLASCPAKTSKAI